MYGYIIYVKTVKSTEIAFFGRACQKNACRQILKFRAMKKVKEPFLLQLADVDKMCSPRYTLTENTAVALPPSAAAANAETVEKKLSIYAKQVIFLRLELREKQKYYQWSLSSF